MMNFYEETNVKNINGVILSRSNMFDRDEYQENDIFGNIRDMNKEELDFYSVNACRLA